MPAVLSRLDERNGDPSASNRTDELFSASLGHLQARTSGLFFYLLLIQYAAGIVIAVVWSPLAWSGAKSSIHFHVWMAVIFGGLLISLPLYLIRTTPASPLTRHLIAIAQMLTGSLFIHLTGGRIETHFHIFGSLAFLAFYRDIRVLATATIVSALDHLLRGFFIPQSIYGVLAVSPWRLLEHAFWMMFEDAFLAIACLQGLVQLREMASQRAQLERVNQSIERAVCTRTQELSLKTEELAAARDAAMDSARIKTQFLANISHELRTPMNGVIGMTELTLTTELNAEQRSYISFAKSSAEDLLVIIENVLDFSKTETGKLKLERNEFSLKDTFLSMADVFGLRARKKGLKLTCDVDSGVPGLLTGDIGRLRQILTNLIENSLKFTELGEISVLAKEDLRSGDRVILHLSVRDTGIGIPSDKQKVIFTAFAQGDGSTTRKYGGTGLGLTLSKRLVEIMGGRIWVESAPGEGSTFHFTVPFQIPVPKPDSSSPSLVMDTGLSRP